jgi:hypothetical protein
VRVAVVPPTRDTPLSPQRSRCSPLQKISRRIILCTPHSQEREVY